LTKTYWKVRKEQQMNNDVEEVLGVTNTPDSVRGLKKDIKLAIKKLKAEIKLKEMQLKLAEIEAQIKKLQSE
jgi:hypothetical protein